MSTVVKIGSFLPRDDNEAFAKRITQSIKSVVEAGNMNQLRWELIESNILEALKRSQSKTP